jgi:SAM-dependent methyltransferase
MENPEEDLRLERKTKEKSVRVHALWSGIKAGMRVLDAGCGPGKTTSLLRRLIQPDGSILGVDYSEKRIKHAKEKYGGGPDIDFRLHDLREPLKDMGMFDFIWARFVLEYNRSESFEIVKHLGSSLKPGGCLCLIDLDYNCLNHYKLPEKMESVISNIATTLEKDFNFDPFVGRKLYSYLYDLKYDDIEVDVMAHHLFYGRIGDDDIFNWQKKTEMATSTAKPLFDEYPGGTDGFAQDFRRFFTDSRRFTYTPVILCKGTKPA